MVFAELAAGREVAALEVWRLLGDREWWSLIRDGRSVGAGATALSGATGVAVQLWAISHLHPSLRADLVWNVAKALAGAPGHCEPELVANVRHGLAEDRRLLEFFRAGNASGLANDAAKRKQTPREFLARSGLPSRVALADNAAAAAVDTFLQDVVGLEGWLIACLQELPRSRRDLAVDALLDCLSDADAARLPALRAALHRWYARTGVVSGGLSAAAAGRLAAWSGLFRWDAFLRFAEQRFGRRLDELPYLQGLGPEAPLPDQAARRALGRMVVWRNYAARILGLRFYVPERSDLALFLGMPGTSPDWVEHRPGVPLRLMVMIGRLLIDVPLDDQEPIRGAIVPRGAGRSFESARAAVGDHPEVEFAIRGFGWQSHLFHALKARQVLPNDGLRAFEGVPRNRLDADGFPLFLDIDDRGLVRKGNSNKGKAKWHSPKPKR